METFRKIDSCLPRGETGLDDDEDDRRRGAAGKERDPSKLGGYLKEGAAELSHLVELRDLIRLEKFPNTDAPEIATRRDWGEEEAEEVWMYWKECPSVSSMLGHGSTVERRPSAARERRKKENPFPIASANQDECIPISICSPTPRICNFRLRVPQERR